MASQQLESHIIPLSHEPGHFIPSSPPVPDPESCQQMHKSHLEHHGVEEFDQQYGDFQSQICGSLVEETQYQSVELDTQATGGSSPSAHFPSSQLGDEAKNSIAPLVVFNQSIQLLSRPDVADNADLAAGFTFAPAGKPLIKLSRPPVPAKPKVVEEHPVDEDIPNGAKESLQPKSSVASHVNVSSRHGPLPEAMIPNSTREIRMRTSSEINGKGGQESPQQEALSIPVAAHDPQLPISEDSNERSAQKSSIKSHRRIKKPFPEVAGPPNSRRWHGNFSLVNQQRMESLLTKTKYKFEGNTPAIFPDVSQTRTFSPMIDEVNNNTRHHHFTSELYSSGGDHHQVSDRTSHSTAQEQHLFPAKSVGRARSPRRDRNSAWNLNKQQIRSESVRPLDSSSKQMDLAPGVQTQSEPLHFIDEPPSKSDGVSEPITQKKDIEQQATYNNDLQEEVSDGPFHEVEGDALEEAQLSEHQPAALNEFDHRFAFPIIDPVLFRASSEVPSRPQSRRSNYGKPVTRPVSLQELRPQGVLEPTAQRGCHSTKIKKSSNATSRHILTTQCAVTGQERHRTRPTAGFFDDYKKFLANGYEYLQVLQVYERQTELVESQKCEIEKLRDTSDISIKKIQTLESEKADLAEKLQKFTDLSSKYKKHMNEVVKAQKYLKIQASEIQRKANEAIEARNAKETILRKLESAIMDAKSLRVPAEKFENVLKLNEELEAKNKMFVSENENFGVHVEELRKENESLTLDNNKLQADFGAATRMCKLLEADVGKALMELSREKYHVEQLVKALGDPPTSLETLVELLKKIPKEVAEELNKQEGLLAQVLDLGKASQAKVDEAKMVSSNDRSQEAEHSAALVKLIEDLLLRFERSTQSWINDATAQQRFKDKILEDFKKTVDELRLDKEAEIQLHNRITELEQTNEALALNKNSREREIRGFTTRVDELKQDLDDCRGQLIAKASELAIVLAAPKEDLRLKAQIQDLETAKNAVTSQFQRSNQEIVKLKEELTSFQESVRLQNQKIQGWEQIFSEAQSTIKNLAEEKNNCLANKRQEIEKACQEARQNTAKSAEASKTTLKMKLESEVNHLEQRVKERDAELALAGEELQRAQQGSDAHGENVKKLRGELALYKEQFIQQIAQLKRLEEQNPGRETFDRLTENLQSVWSECTELRNLIRSIRSASSQNIEAAMRSQQAIEGNLCLRDDMENEIEKLREANAELQKRLESVNMAYSQQNAPQSGHGVEWRSIGGAKNLILTTPLGMLPLTQQTQKLTQDPISSSANPDRLRSHSISTNDSSLDSHVVCTPGDALRKAARGVGSDRTVSQMVQATEKSSVKVVGNSEKPQTWNHKILSEGSVLFNSPRVSSGSASQTKPEGSNTSPLRPAGRKNSKYGHSDEIDAGNHYLRRTETVTQDFQTAYIDNSHNPDAMASKGVLGFTPFSEVALKIPTTGRFTALLSMMHEVESTETQEELPRGFENNRHSNKSDAPVTNDNAPGNLGLQNVAQRTVESLKRNEVAETNTVPRIQGRRNPPSTTEEAIRRRTTQPSKSAIKRKMLASNADAESIFAPRTITTVTQSKASSRARGKDPSHIPDVSRGSYNRAVHGGKPQTPRVRIPSVADESSIGASNGTQQSPQNIPLPKRNVPKRLASFIAQNQHAAKRIRTSKAVSFAKGDVVPDSQEICKDFENSLG